MNLAWVAWADVSGGRTVAAAMIDRIVHHAEVLTLKGARYRLKNVVLETLPSVKNMTENATE